MTSTERQRARGTLVIRRITVALDSASDNRFTFDAAAALAAHLDAEIAALFVEELDLLNCARLPFVRQISLPAAAEQSLDQAETERTLRAVAGQSRRALSAAAGRRKVAWSFRVIRGRMERALPAAARKGELTIIGGPGRSPARRLWMRTTIQAAARCAGPVLMLDPEQGIAGPVTIVIDDGARGHSRWLGRALAVGARLAEAQAVPLVILVAGADAAAGRLETRARHWLDDHGYTAEIRRFFPGGAARTASDALMIALGRPDHGIVLIAANSPLMGDETTLAAIRRLGRAILQLP